jgi:hypothetical protein
LKIDGRISPDGLEGFYLVILRHAVPSKCKPVVIQRLKAVIAIQVPLPITALKHFVHPRSASDIYAVLRRLRSVIMPNKGTPQSWWCSNADRARYRCQESMGQDGR